MASKTKPIRLFWWDERRFLHKKKENYGDMLSRYLVSKISDRPVRFVHPKKQSWLNRNKKHFAAIGSILAHVTKNSVVWGSGIIDRKHDVEEADFRAVRGPETRKFLLALGYNCPEVYGDPALLLPRYYFPKSKAKFELGIIPHYKDYDRIAENYKGIEGLTIIDMMSLDVESTTDRILECKKIISSSLHGVIVGHAYNIPALWVKFSNEPFGDDIKFKDYYSSVKMHDYKSPEFNYSMNEDDLLALFKTCNNLPDKGVIEDIQKDLLTHCPFK